MTDTVLPLAAGCAACGAAPQANVSPREPRKSALRRIEISLPGIHCAACISGVESGLLAEPGVAGARVNLTLKRVSVTVEDTPGAEERMIAALGRRGYEAHRLDSSVLESSSSDIEGRDLLARIGVAGFASMNVMLLSVAVWAGAADTTREVMYWLSAAITLPAVAFSAFPFYSSAWRAIRAGRMDMDVPISVAILMAAATSLSETILSGRNAYYEAAIMLTFFLLVGRYLAFLTRSHARSAAAELAALEVRTADRIQHDGTRETVPLDALRPGDLIAVAPGSRIPVDGIVSTGMSEIDPSLLTGETLPLSVSTGSVLRAGMLNLTGALTVSTREIGEETLLGQISRLVEASEQSRGRYASLAQRASKAYAPLVAGLSLVALLYWGISSSDWRLAMNVAAAVLIVTCPCGLGLAVPAVLTAASGRLFRDGVLLKDGTALEKLAQVDTIVFDKTGTLTTGRPVLANAQILSDRDFGIAAALAAGSNHPLSRAIRFAAEASVIRSAEVLDIVEVAGLGTQGRLGRCPVRIGRAEWVGASEVIDRTATWLRVGEDPAVPLLFEDEVRPEAAETVKALRANGLDVILLSGDADGAVGTLARQVGIEKWVARATPTEKVAMLQYLAGEGRRVLMVGDGLNDAAALSAAYVSMSPASAVDATRAAADIIITSNSIDRVFSTWQLARSARRRIIENFVFAFSYNFITVPIAFAGLVTPLFAAIAMSVSSLAVCVNAMRVGGDHK